MCGRFALKAPTEGLAEPFGLDSAPALEARYNIAPGTLILAVRQNPERPARELVPLHWGLVPFWSKDKKIGQKLINARSETVHEKPSFKGPFRHKRCLVPADFYYEWQKKEDGKKQPWVFRMKDEKTFAIAGLWEHWEGSGGEVVESCTLLTTEANDVAKPIHHRMPVILSPEAFGSWLDPSKQSTKEMRALLTPFSASKMEAWPVSSRVNSPRFDEPGCLEPI